MKKLFCLLALSSCAANGFWYKPNSSQEELNKARYLCLKESQQPESRSYYNKGFDDNFVKRKHYESSSGMTTNYTLFNACMQAQGFYWKVVEPQK